MEVMGLMLGEFVDDYTVQITDVFAMPQSGTGVSVEAVDPVFQTNMLDMLKQTGRPEMVVGWYHSHPGFGNCHPISSVFVSSIVVYIAAFDGQEVNMVVVIFQIIMRMGVLVLGCWLSGVDVNTQQSFEALNQRAVSVVIDPIQSVKGKVVIDAFRLINPQTLLLQQEPRQTTANVGHLVCICPYLHIAQDKLSFCSFEYHPLILSPYRF